MMRSRDDADVIVVGAGLSGLSCAHALARAGLRVLVLEAGSRAGGRARSWTDATTGERVDIGPHVVHSLYPNFLELLDQLGTLGHISWSDRDLLQAVAPGHARPVHLSPLPAPLHLAPGGLAMPWLTLGDKLSLWRTGWFLAGLRETELGNLDGIPAERLLRFWGVSERALDVIWRSVAMAILNQPLEQCSARALMRFARHGLGQSGIRLGFPAIGLGDLFVPGCEQSVRAANGRILLRSEVASVETGPEGFRGVRLTDGRRFRARAGVVAVSPQAIPPLMPGVDRARLAPLGSLEPSRYLSTWLWFGEKLTEEKCWTQLWSPENWYYDFYDLSNIRRNRSRNGSLIAANLIYSQRLGAVPDDRAIEQARAELARFLPGARTAPLLHARVNRVPMAIPCEHPGTGWTRPGTRCLTSRLCVASDWADTGEPVCMDSAVHSGWRAAEAVSEDFGQAVRLARTLPEPGGFCRPLRWLPRFLRGPSLPSV